MRQYWHRFMSPDAGDGAGGGTGGKAGERKPLAEEDVERIISRSGGSNEAVTTLLKDNLRYRERHREDTNEINRLLKIAPPEGAIIIKEQADVDFWKKLKEGKIDAAAFEKMQKDLVELNTFKSETEEDKAVRAAAEVAGYNPDILADQVKLRKLELVMEEVTVEKEEDGKKVQVKEKRPHVRPKGDTKAKLEVLDDAYIEREMKPYAVALKAKVGEEAGSTTSTSTQGGGGTKFPVQRPASSGGKQETGVAGKALTGYSSPVKKATTT